MIVTRLEELEKAKFKVYIDDSYAFLLYRKDIDINKLEVGMPITLESYEKILNDTVYRRAKQKAVAILKFMDRTEQEIRNKLSDAEYTEDIINRTISYVLEYGYLDNERYTAAYVRSRMYTKSKLVIKMELLHKGISRDMLDRILQEEYEKTEACEDVELIAIRKALAKKTKDPEALNMEEKKKIMASLYRKGFDIGRIKEIMK